MKVAMIGTGNVGQALAWSLLRAGHDVTLAARDVEETRQVAGQLGASSADTPADAVSRSEVAILAVPYGALRDVADAIAVQAAGKVIIDLTNPGPTTESGVSAAEEVAEALPEAHVAKAFNTLFGSLMAQPELQGRTVDALFATDSDEARPVLAELIASLGFRPIDAGSLSSARQMEALAWLNIQLQMRYGGDWSSTFILLGAPAGAVAQPAVPIG